MTDWKECKLGELCSDIAYGYTESASLEPVGPKFLRITDIVPGRVSWASVPYCKISNENQERYKLQLGDIVIARTGATTGYTYTVKPTDLKHDAVFASYLIRYRIDREKAEPFYIGHLLTSRLWDGFVEGILGGSAQPGANAKQFADFEILLPPLPEQRAIAGVLSSLDDKIDLLHRQNKTLEGMAEALWRKMFVEEADNSWKETSLLEIIDLVGGGTPKTETAEYWDGSVPWLSAKDITSNHKSFIFQTEKNISELGLENSSAILLPKYATIISARGTVGNYCILSSAMAFSQSNYGVLPKIDGCYYFTYLLIAFIVDELKSAAYGSVFDTITTNTFREQKIILPEKGKILFFEKEIKYYFEKIYNNTIQIRTLSHLRDTLLPKLMSGEVKTKKMILRNMEVYK